MAGLGNTLYEFLVKIKMDSNDAFKGLKDLNEKLAGADSVANKFLGNVGKLGKSAIEGLVKDITTVTKQSIDAYAEYEQMVGGVQKLFGNMGMSLEEYATDVGKSVDDVRVEWQGLEDAQNAVIKNAKNAYMTAGMDMNTYLNTATSMSAKLIQDLGGDSKAAAEMVDKAMIAISDNWNTFGGDLGMIQGAFQGFMRGNYTMLDNLKLGYGGTRAEMQRLIADANEYAVSIGEAGDLTISNFADIIEAVDLIQQKQHIAGTTAREATTTISGSLNMLKASWSNLLIAISDPDGDVEGALNAVVMSFDNVAKNIVPVIERVLPNIASLIEKIVPMIATRIPELAEMLVPAVVKGAISLVTALIQNLPEILQILFSAIKEALGAMFETLGEAFPGLKPLFDGLKKMTDGVFGWLAEHGEAVIKILGMILVGFLAFKVVVGILRAVAIAQGILNLVMSMNPIGLIVLGIGLLIAAGIALVNWVKENTEVFIYIWEKLKAAWQAVVDFFKETIDAIVQGFTVFVNAIKDIVEAIIGFFVNLANGVKEAFDRIIQFAQNVKDKVTGFFQNIIDFVKGFPDKMRDIGRRLLEGLWNGIRDKIQWLKDRITGLIDKIKGWFTGKDGFDEHSPSKWAREVFSRVMEGSGIGVEDEIPNLVNTARKAIGNFQDAFSPDGGVTVDVSTMASPDKINGLGKQIQNDVQINVYAAEGQDVREIADEIERRIVNKYQRLGVAFG